MDKDNIQDSLNIEFNFNEESNEVIASYSSDQGPITTTQSEIEDKLRTLNFDQYDIDQSMIAQLIESMAQGNSCSFVIGLKKDGCADIQISDDQMLATLNIIKAYGGKEIEYSDIITLIEQEKLHGLVEIDDTRQLIHEATAAPFVIAKGLPPIHGEDAKYDSLITYREEGPTERQDGSVNLLDIKDFTVVDTNAVVMKRTPPTPGTDGFDVLGNTIQALPGKDDYQPEEHGTKINPEDPSQVLATMKGHPILVNHYVHISPNLEFDNIDISTGNVDFDGSIIIKGEVTDGLTVNVTGDIHIYGNVNKATIKAGNDIVINGGVLGKIEDTNEYAASIKAGGQLQAKFLNMTLVKANGPINIEEYSFHSDIESRDKITIGINNGKGVILGGKAWGHAGISCNTIGSDSNIKTFLRAGNLQEGEDTYKKKMKELSARKNEYEQLSVIYKKIKSGEPSKVGKVSLNKTKKIRNTIQFLKQITKKLSREIKELTIKNQLEEKICITVFRTSYPNVHLSINNRNLKLEEQQSVAGKFINADSTLTFQPLTE